MGMTTAELRAKLEERRKERGALTGEEREKFYRDKVYNNKKNNNVRKDTKEVAPLSGYSQSFDDVKAAPSAKKDIIITDKIKSVSPVSGYAQRFKENDTGKKAESLPDKIKSVSPLSPAGQKINLDSNPGRLKELQEKKNVNDMNRAIKEARNFLQADDSVSPYELFDKMKNLTADDVNRLIQSETERNKDLSNKFLLYVSTSPGNIGLDEKDVLEKNLSESNARLQQYRIWINENELEQKAAEVKKQYGSLQNEPDFWKYVINAKPDDAIISIGNDKTREAYRYFTDRIANEDHGKAVTYLPGDNVNLVNATREEMNNFIYLYNAKGKEYAKEYIEAIESDLEKRQSKKTIKAAEERGKEHPVLSTAETILSYVPASIMGGTAVAKSAFTGKVNPYSSQYTAVTARETERELPQALSRMTH